MEESIKQFSVNDIEIDREDDDLDFAHVKIYAFADKNNSHKNPISTEVLKRYADTILGKFIVAKFNKKALDVESHEVDESILGYIDPREKVEFVEKEINGELKTFLVINGLLSKIYAREVVDMFKTMNERTVSCEFSCIEGETDENGDTPILSYHMHGITILGLAYRPSISGTEIKVMKFAEQFAEINKEEEMAEEIKDFSESEQENIVMEEEKVTTEAVEVMSEEPIIEKEMGCGEGKTESEVVVEAEEVTEEETPKEEKKFSLDSYADMGAILVMLEKETEQNIELAKKVMSEMSPQDIVTEFVSMAKELYELKSFKESIDNAEKEKKFSSIMATVKEDLDEKAFAELQEEGKSLTLEQLGAFENKVKAFAYEVTKGSRQAKGQEEILVFAMDTETENTSEITADDVYNKYLNK